MRTLICPECNTFDRMSRVGGRPIHMPDCPDCRAMMVELDDEVAPVIAVLNQKGYITQASCGAHLSVGGDLTGTDSTKVTPIFENTAHIVFRPVLNGYHFNPDDKILDEEGEPVSVGAQTLHRFFEGFNEEKKITINFTDDVNEMVVTVSSDMRKLTKKQDSSVATQAIINIGARLDGPEDPYRMKNAVNRAWQILFDYVRDHLEPAGPTEYANWGKNPELYKSERHPNYDTAANEYGYNICEVRR